MITRRNLMIATGAAALTATCEPLWSETTKRKVRISACDWSIGKRGSIDAVALGKKIGLDAIEASFGAPGGSADLRDDKIKKQYRDACKKHQMQLSSLAMGVLNGVPFSSDPRTVQWVSDAIDAAAAMKLNVILLAFFGKGDIRGKKDLTAEVIRRFKKLAPKAEKAGVTLGIESWLSAEEHMHIIDSVGSKSVQVYYDVANSNKMGYGIYKELRLLGKKGVVCQVHCKENGYLLGHGRIDFKKVRAALDSFNYPGWLTIESAVPRGKPMFDAYVHNQKFLRAVFS